MEAQHEETIESSNFEELVSTRTSTPSPQTSLSRISSKERFVALLHDLTLMAARPSAGRPRVLGVHHLKFAVSNLDVSIAWYERVLGGHRIPSLDHVRQDGSRFAAVLQMLEWSGLFLELRQTEAQALKERGWDPITLTVKGKDDLSAWIAWLERWGTVHSPLLTGRRGWLVVFEDPDGRRIRMYTKEEHGGTEVASSDEAWLSEP